MNHQSKFVQCERGRRGFTLVELLIAMTITLLLMAGLAKTFAMIGNSIKRGRSKVSLSSKMRGVSFRLRGDLRARTINARPPASTEAGQGYFMYYEGPLTEQTFSLYGACPERTLTDGSVVYPFIDPDNASAADARFFGANAGPTYRLHSRLGDFDDYIAFTAEAPGDDWFTGKVPAYLVDDDAVDPMEPRIIRSKLAEIIIWASPKWQVDPASNTLQTAAHPSGMPLYLDADNNLIPDSVTLHQRILLIRPDLNARRTIPNADADLAFDGDVLRPWGDNVNPARVPAALERLYPIGIQNPASTATPAPQPMFGQYANSQSDTDNSAMLQSNWLVGMTPLHHFFDLSIRRIVHPVTGEPTGYVAANSLQDLVQPENRFAHVRYPGRYMNRANPNSGGSFDANATNPGYDGATSMPLLALGWNDTILSWQGAADPRTVRTSAPTAPPWFPSSHPSPRTRNSAGNGDSLSGLFNGWLLPQFELGDANPVGTSSGDHWERGYLSTVDARWDRTGEDVLAANVFAFDVKGFDRSAPLFMTSGPDGQPGIAGNDDDGNGTIDLTAASPPTVDGLQPLTELGSAGSDDIQVAAGDLASYGLMGQAIMSPDLPVTFFPPPAGSPVHLQALASRGAFVDLLYPYLAGSPLRERTAEAVGTLAPLIPTTPRPSAAVTGNNLVKGRYDAFLQSELSLFPIPTQTLDSMKRSGKLLHGADTGEIYFFQPTYDTWTDRYEVDGFDQSHTDNGSVSDPGRLFGTTWVLNDLAGANRLTRVPRLLDNSGLGVAPLQIDTGRYVPDEPETSPPISSALPAISITFRFGDPATGGMTDFSVVEGMQ